MATATEREVALAITRDVRDYLTDLGYPEPVSADSGNGGHLVYGLDLPNELFKEHAGACLDKNNDLVKKFLSRLKEQFPQVDSTTFNPARITKLYGTMVRKGAGIDERPHRPARLLAVPQRLEPIPRELLAAVVGERTNTMAHHGGSDLASLVEMTVFAEPGEVKTQQDHPEDERADVPGQSTHPLHDTGHRWQACSAWHARLQQAADAGRRAHVGPAVDSGGSEDLSRP
jgi:hypothetical protein